MSERIRLRGMTWSHPRGLDPLLAASEAFRSQGVDVEWDARSLQGFEEASIKELAAQYDLIAIDHPFMGKAFLQGALQPVDAIVGEAFLQGLAAASVGPSFASYGWKGSTWAVPVDAAAQVAAYRPDLLASLGHRSPTSWDEVFALADGLPEGVHIGVPANPTHVFLAFGTICQAVAPDTTLQGDLRPAWWGDDGFDPKTAVAALAIMRKLLAVSHPMSGASDPIEIFEHMLRHDDIVYSPIAFGYSNYARPPSGLRPLAFQGVPSLDGSTGSGMLGGVGLAVSAQCRALESVGAFLRFVADKPVQSGLYASSGGQPAHREAWTDTHVNAICPAFFDTTLASLDVSFVRPRVPAYPRYQVEAGALLHRLLQEQARDNEVVEKMNNLWVALQLTEFA